MDERAVEREDELPIGGLVDDAVARGGEVLAHLADLGAGGEAEELGHRRALALHARPLRVAVGGEVDPAEDRRAEGAGDGHGGDDREPFALRRGAARARRVARGSGAVRARGAHDGAPTSATRRGRNQRLSAGTTVFARRIA
jgi:hypothetical protein